MASEASHENARAPHTRVSFRVTSRDSPQMESLLAGYNGAHYRHNPQSTQSHSKLAFRDSQSLQMENSPRTLSTRAGQ